MEKRRKEEEGSMETNKLLDPYSVSTYSPENAIPFEHEGETYFCIGFEKGQQLVFLGYSLIGTLFGSIDIGGATITSSHDIPTQLNKTLEPSHTVSFFPTFSPRTSALTVVRSIPYEKTAIVSPSPTLTSTYSDLNPLLESFMPRWDTLESIIIVKNMEWCGVEQLEIINPSLRNLFRLDNKKDFVLNDGPLYEDMAGFQPITKVTPEVRAMKIEPSWSAKVDDVLKFEQAPSVSMVCGTKNVGKSSFARYMINRLLKVHQRVAYLETDVGQTEFTPSGLVSLNIVESPLLGPAFTHLNLKSKRSFFIGSTSPKNDSTYYQDCIHQLLHTYRQEVDAISDHDANQYQLLPLVVNTSGWIKGLGYDLLLKIVEYVEPTHIFSLSSISGGYGHNLPEYFADHVTASQQTSPSGHHPVLLSIEAPTMTSSDSQSIPSLPNQRQRRTILPSTMADKYQAIDQRNLMMISYMYHDAQAFGTRQQGRGWWNVNPRLVNRVPWTIDWRQHLQGIWVLFEDVPLPQLLYALNGSLVGLVGNANNKTEGEAMELEEETDAQQAASTNGEKGSKSQSLAVIPPKYHSPMTSAPPNPSTTTCYGLGIIRAIDPEQHRIHLLTPLPLDHLCHVNALVKGDLDIPVHIMLDQYVGARNQNCGVPWRQVPYLSHDVIDSIGSSAPKLRRNVMRRSQQRIG
ncbi:hypothetical protein BCR42DRAFT_225280 [Absidia repens]|uniref:Polynucleotide 5'-hydroxyl-kinase GRC3 n=1 Tax=Absidia repens TaxID=90262 RepID=A0A1X2IPA9_9FUNG|nr:hypothetical protein BCR42DRAFT_225280 [Absidia repens]